MTGEEAIQKAMSMGFACDVPQLKDFFKIILTSTKWLVRYTICGTYRYACKLGIFNICGEKHENTNRSKNISDQTGKGINR